MNSIRAWTCRKTLRTESDSICELRTSHSAICKLSEEHFVSHQRVSGFPERGLICGEVWGTSGLLGKLPGSLWRKALIIHSQRSCGEVAEELLGKFGGILGSPGHHQKMFRARSRIATPPPAQWHCLRRVQEAFAGLPAESPKTVCCMVRTCFRLFPWCESTVQETLLPLSAQGHQITLAISLRTFGHLVA